MDKYVVSGVILAILALNVYAAPVQAPVMGEGIDALIQVIENNTRTVVKTQNSVEGLSGMIEKQMDRWVTSIIVGCSLFTLLIILVKEFLDHYRKLRKKRTYEEYINEMEDKYKQMIVHNVAVLAEINRKIEELKPVVEIPANDERKARMRNWNKGFLTGALLILIIRLIEVVING